MIRCLRKTAASAQRRCHSTVGRRSPLNTHKTRNDDNNKILNKRWIYSSPKSTRSASSSIGMNLFLNNNGNSNLSRKNNLSTAAVIDDAADQQQQEVGRFRIRNTAIVAHVDHGKTTLVDKLLQVAGGSGASDESGDLVMDSGELEQERGITITSKVTRLGYNDHIINVVDTPGHADFAGEVDRILGMVSGVCLLVDASEGCMAQTKYVLSRALALGLNPICVLNKLDKGDAIQRLQSGEVENELLDLFDELGATDEQMDYTTVFASGRSGWATLDEDIAIKLASSNDISAEDISEANENSMHTVLKTILNDIPPPPIYDHNSGSFSMAATNVGYDSFLGRTCTGRIYSGSIELNDNILVLPRDKEGNANTNINNLTSSVSGIFVNRGVSRTSLEEGVASAGDIVTIAGVPDLMKVGDTLTLKDKPVQEPIETPPLAPPTLSMDFGANSSPLMGREGSKVTSSQIRDRLIKETDNNVTLQVEPVESDMEKTRVYARGELQLGILIEQMRREGFELTVSPPQITTRECPETRQILEPYEEVIIDVDDEYAGAIVNLLTSNTRGGVLMSHQTSSSSSSSASGDSQNKTRIIFEIPARGLIGLNSELATIARGSAVLNHIYIEDRPINKALDHGNLKGKLISTEQGKATLYALSMIAERGTLFVEDGDAMYPGLVIGENSRDTDMDVNPVKAKQVSNIRNKGKEESLYVPPPVKRSVEEYIGYMSSDEVIEVTPESVRLRKKELDPGVRARQARSRKKSQAAKAK